MLLPRFLNPKRSFKIISGILEESGFDVIDEGLKVMWNNESSTCLSQQANR